MRYRRARPHRRSLCCRDKLSQPHARLKSIGKSAGVGLLIAEDELLELGADFAGSLAVFALDIALDFLGDILVSLACEDIGGRLDADHLAHRGDKRRIAEILTDSGSLLKHFVELIELLLSRKLGDKV